MTAALIIAAIFYAAFCLLAFALCRVAAMGDRQVHEPRDEQ